MPVGCQIALTSDLNSHPNISVERAPYSRNPTVELRDELTCDQWEGDFKIAVKEKKLLKSKNGENLLVSLANGKAWESWQNKRKPVK